ncbi:GNAT family N-acetyltransferase [Streptomyces longisporoflavus]|uniref:GNAT family N-acetyltransferase n=1 Tax=Streptomyces longisporoflavus TaxID=28044 RepID=A0ABW7QHB6_9ACTN
MNEAVILRVSATPTAPALVLRPWRLQDAAALVDAYRDPHLRRWTSSVVDNAADAARWLRSQQEGWATGERLDFAVIEEQPHAPDGRLSGSVVLKEAAPGRPCAEVGYWTAAHARGRGVAGRALEVLTGWAFDTFGATGLERLELLHQEDNLASCRVAHKARYELDRILPAAPPSFPRDGHLHVRHAP